MHTDLEDDDTQAILRMNGGMSVKNWAMQFLSDTLGAPVDCPEVLETTALGVAWLAGQRAGFIPTWMDLRKNGLWNGGLNLKWTVKPQIGNTRLGSRRLPGR
jgi:glycerol kinase